ncbi:carbonic anhydrase [Anaerobacillus alkaliphilus]|uniref:Carbonic anhydrase n=1 Tax=Anaerobacillus alkaliphilus TaxID=1548597 RepID=A0A4Q0VV08_9BACI|nr:ATP-grasp fold amidoligase family protein [Anaerobacillus alkaliphilus]RXJ02254.1 carbonic anhydrase [Anaerobacillus alkaliphilus]
MKLKDFVNNSFVKAFIKFTFSFLTDKQIIKLQHRTVLRRKLDLKNPQRFTEKIQWYKLNYRSALMTQCADKYRVRDYIIAKGYKDTLVELYQVVDGFEDINFEKLPKSFVIKSNKGSGTNLFIKDKGNIDLKSIEKSINRWKTVNTVLMGREWAYKNIRHKIVIEEMLEDSINPNESLFDYKFLCFNGNVKYIMLDIDRNSEHKRNFYDIEWNLLDIKSKLPARNIASKSIPKPDGLKYMIEIAESIARDFPFVRVDFYWVNNKVYFGEITFYPWSGCVKFSPDSFDFHLGELFELPYSKIIKE